MALSRRSASLAGFFALSIAVTVGACADREDPLLPRGPEGPEVPVAPEKPLAYITCDADLRANTVACGAAAPDAGAASAQRYTFGSPAGKWVRVVRSDVGNAFNAADSTFQFDIKLANLIPQALGTDDGTALAPHGVRVFLLGQPVVTVGAGTANVTEPDTTAIFTAPGQRFTQWDEIIQPGDTTVASKHWTFQLGGSVSNFSWTFAVNASLRWPNMVIADRAADTLAVGETVDLEAAYTNHLGDTIPPPTITWSSETPAVATVDGSTGVVTAVAKGTSNVIASAPGARPDTVVIVVNDVPVVTDRSYRPIGNVTLAVADSLKGLLGNATDSNNDAVQVTSTGALTTARGGTATLSANGTFTYLSPAGLLNQRDSVQFTASDGVVSQTKWAKFEVTRRFWYVEPGAAGSSDGRDTSPFTTIAGADAASADGDTILVRTGTGTDATSIVLAASQVLIGQGIAANLSTTHDFYGTGTPEAFTLLAAGTSPTIARGTAGATVTLATGNTIRTIRGLTLGASNGAAISGTGFGTLTVSETNVSATGPALDLSTGTLAAATFAALSSSGSGTTGLSLTSVDGTLTATSGSITNPTGTAFNVSGGNVAITYPGSISTNASRSVSITGRSTGAIVLSGTISDVGSGILVQNNTGGTVTFSGSSQTLSTAANNAVTLDSNTGATINFTGGALAITTTSGSGFVATGGGTVNVTGGTNDVSTGAGAALNLNGVTVGASGMALRSVSSSSATPVVLTSVTGNVTAAQGTITAGAGTAFAVNGGSVNVTWAGNITQTNTGNRLLSVSNAHAGTLTFTGTLMGTNSTGLLFDGANGTYNVNGTATLNNTVALGDAGIDVQGGSTGTFSFGSGVAITNPVGIGLNVTTSAPTSLTYAGTISTGAASSNPVSITSLTGGSVTVSGGITSTGQGILVQNNSTGSPTITFSGGKSLSTGANTAVNLSSNTGATVNFTGGQLAITTTAGTGFNATGGGTVNVTSTGSDNDISTGTGAALNLNGVTVGGSGLNLRTVSATGAASAVVLTTVTGGNVTAASGTITGAAGTPFSVAGGNVNVTWNGSISQATNNHLLNVSLGHTGTITFQTGTLSATNGTGLQFNNADGTYNFNGTVTLNNTVVGGNAGIDVLNGSGGTFSFGSGVAITNPTFTTGTTGVALFVDASAPASLTYAGSISTGVASANPVSITSLTAGTSSITISGGITSTGQGILVQNNILGTHTILFSGGKTLNTVGNAAVTLDNNDNATITFGTAAMAITTTGGAGFRAVNGGTVNVTGTANDVATTTGTAVTVSGTTIGAGGAHFRSVSANGAANGIVLNGTGSNSLQLAGNGGTCTVATPTCTGGTIQNTTGAGVQLTAATASLTRLRVRSSGSHGVDVTGAGNLTLISSYLETNGNGDEENGLNLLNVAGTVLIDGSAFRGAAENLIRVDNNNANLTFTVQNASTFEFPNPEPSAFRNSAILITPKGSSAVTATVTGATFRNIPNYSFQFAPDASVTATGNATFTNNTLSADVGLNVTCASNPQCRVGHVGVGGTGGITNFVATGNNFNRVNGDGVFILGANQSSTLRMRIENNTISNALDDAFVVGLGQSARVIAQFNSNTISNIGADVLEVASGESNAAFGAGSASDMDLVFTNNSMNTVGTNASLAATGGPGVFRFGDADQTLCLAFTGNSMTGPLPTPGIKVYLDGNFGVLGGTMTYEGTGVGALTDAKIQADNPGMSLTPATTVINAVNLSNGATCQRPGI